MKHEVVIADNEVVVRLSEALTFSDHGAFRDVLKNVIASESHKCIFDLSKLESVDSAGLGMFMIASEELEKENWKMVLRSPRGQVKQLLDLAKIKDVVTIEA